MDAEGHIAARKLFYRDDAVPFAPRSDSYTGIQLDHIAIVSIVPSERLAHRLETAGRQVFTDLGQDAMERRAHVVRDHGGRHAGVRLRL
jgi:hypothetical protein